MQRAVIPEAKIEGLRQALERDHVVRFKNGSQVEYEDCPGCRGSGDVAGDPCPRCKGRQVRLRVERSAGGVQRYPLTREGLTQAYGMALDGPAPKDQPPGDPADYGETMPC